MNTRLITVPGELPTLNEIIAASKSHYMKYSNMKSENTGLVRLHSLQVPKAKRVDVDIVWYCANRRKDPDNISGGGTKFVLDGLVEAGVLKNDGWNEINSIKHAFAIDKDNPRIEIRLKEVTG